MRIEGSIPADAPREEPRRPDAPRRLSVVVVGGGASVPALVAGLSRFAPGGHALPPVELAAVIAATRLRPDPVPTPRELHALRHADVVVIGPGDLEGCVLPALRAPGVTAALRGCGALRILVEHVEGEPEAAAAQTRAVLAAAGRVVDVVIVEGEGARADERRELAAMGVLPIEADLGSGEGLDPRKLAAAVLGIAVEALVA
jgi:2-phospho-L-lactate transferase/gluconeogenesis factor (CofD/UPF0052 family)